MGMCVGKSSHHSPSSRNSWTCTGTTCLKDTDTVRLLVFDAADDKYDNRTAKSEEEVFGYHIIPQDGEGTKHMARKDGKPADRNNAIGRDLSKPFLDMQLVSKKDQKVIYVQPASVDLNVYIVTWNMNGKALARSIARLLDVDGERYDLYVIGLQESHNSIAEPVMIEALGDKYSFVAAASMLSLQLFIIAKKSVLPFLSRPLVDRVSTGGLGGLAGRQKGAVAITLRFKGASLLFIVCHLAPHQGNVRIRNAQYRRISQAVFAKQAPLVPCLGEACSDCSSCKNGVFRGEPAQCVQRPLRSNARFLEQADVVVWMGDLNYRVEMKRSYVAFLVKHKLEEVLWPKDQLTKALKRGHAFIGFQEGPLSFRPTYKYDVGTDNYDTSSKERVPSWTDRILYKVGDASKLNVNLRSYNSINSIKTSDHRPVKALLRLSLNQEKVKYPF